MQLKLGEKIRELRRRDGRTQETLAEALGVSSQAVSRWEANGGYPDMEIIPAIANYFHITIDELFGYSVERNQKIKKIIAEADAVINTQGDMEQCVANLREAVSEFPTDAQILLHLGFALKILGWQKYGARGFTKENCDYTINDSEYNSKNPYWNESQLILQKALDLGLGPDDRMAVILNMVMQYATIGNYDKAEEIAQKQDPLMICRECLLPFSSEGEKRDIFQGEALIALTRQLKNVLQQTVTSKLSLAQSETGVQKLIGIVELYKLIVDDENYGVLHADLRDIYIISSVFTARLGNLKQAMEYFDIGFQHQKGYESIRGKGLFHYTSQLVSKVTFPSANWPMITGDSAANTIKGWLSAAPKELVDEIRKQECYSDCFVN